jgi:predicted nuclease with TOPRIM domain
MTEAERTELLTHLDELEASRRRDSQRVERLQSELTAALSAQMKSTESSIQASEKIKRLQTELQSVRESQAISDQKYQETLSVLNAVEISYEDYRKSRMTEKIKTGLKWGGSCLVVGFIAGLITGLAR